jgi:hypothetical protein
MREVYPATDAVVVAWGTTGAVDGAPLAVLIATAGHIITGYIDTQFDSELESEERIDHNEPNATRRRAALLARLRQVSKATWLLIHDADEIDGWTTQGFRGVEPPPEVPTGVGMGGGHQRMRPRSYGRGAVMAAPSASLRARVNGAFAGNQRDSSVIIPEQQPGAGRSAPHPPGDQRALLWGETYRHVVHAPAV